MGFGAAAAFAAATTAAPAPFRGNRGRPRIASSLLSLTSVALYQQSAKVRDVVFSQLAPELAGMWPGREGGNMCSEASAVAAAAAMPLYEAAFTNSQPLADRWLSLELEHLLAAAAVDDAVPSLHRARLLTLWSTDVASALALYPEDLFFDGGGTSASVSSSAWVWAALAHCACALEHTETLTKLVDGALDRNKALGGEALHHVCAAALALERPLDAVRLYLRADLIADALLLARLRLPARHPLISHVYKRWAESFERRSRPDQAAACLLAIGHQWPGLAHLQELSSGVVPERNCVQKGTPDEPCSLVSPARPSNAGQHVQSRRWPHAND